ncbi:MAG: sugar transferase [Acidimicrobiales bacterium]
MEDNSGRSDCYEVPPLVLGPFAPRVGVNDDAAPVGLVTGSQPGPASWRPLARYAIAAGDALALTAAALTHPHQPVLAAAFAVACFLGLLVTGTQHPRLNLSMVSQSRWLARQLVWPLAAGFLLGVLADDPRAVARQGLVSVAAVLAARLASYAALRAGRVRGHLLVPALIEGSGPLAEDVATLLRLNREYGLQPVGVTDRPLPVSATSSHAIAPPARVIVRDGTGLNGEVVGGLRRDGINGTTVYVVSAPSTADLSAARRDIDPVGSLPFVRVAPHPGSHTAWRLKRTFDVVVSLGLLLMTAPVMLVAAVAVKVSSPGPILFRQPRVGQYGAIFKMYKFRTFPVDHVDDKFSLGHAECPLLVGRILRRTSIDELPQLFNVLMGQMCIVGPRPERPHFAEPLARTILEYERRHRVPGGITGAAQVHGLWGDSSVEERVCFDNRYIDEWSLWSDVVILARTLPAVIRKSRSA